MTVNQCWLAKLICQFLTFFALFSNVSIISFYVSLAHFYISSYSSQSVYIINTEHDMERYMGFVWSKQELGHID